jgi:hypothetical protein
MPAVLITGKQHSLTLARLALVRDFRGGSNIFVGSRAKAGSFVHSLFCMI